MKVSIGISNRHVHLTKQDFEVLFGKDACLEKQKDLKQPHNFASTSFVTIKTPKTAINNVRIVGEFRHYNQVELSKTDAYLLGINPPVRESGDVSNGAVVTLVGPRGEITVDSAIIAERHIHITKEQKEQLELPDTVSLKVLGEKSGIIGDVHIKVSEEAYYECHLDTDDANAFLLQNGDELEIIKENDN